MKTTQAVYTSTRRAILQASRSNGPAATQAKAANFIVRGAPSTTSSLPLHRYASQALRRLARERKEARAPGDWMGLVRRAGWGLPVYVPVTAAALFWPYPVKKVMEAR